MMLPFSENLKQTVECAARKAIDSGHEYITPEHVLWDLAADPDAEKIFEKCGVDLEKLLSGLSAHLNTHRQAEEGISGKPSKAYDRLLVRAEHRAREKAREEVTSVDVLAALFMEPESKAVSLLADQNFTRLRVLNCIEYGDPKGMPGLSDAEVTATAVKKEKHLAFLDRHRMTYKMGRAATHLIN